jgi:hypothetical protein
VPSWRAGPDRVKSLRLYGVTMQERGVSRLLSVDLQRAAELAESQPMAAE